MERRHTGEEAIKKKAEKERIKAEKAQEEEEERERLVQAQEPKIVQKK
jgi:hypothetical protein